VLDWLLVVTLPVLLNAVNGVLTEQADVALVGAVLVLVGVSFGAGRDS
jgi:hypothetical protein